MISAMDRRSGAEAGLTPEATARWTSETVNPAVESDAFEQWQSRASQGLWMIAVYLYSQQTQVDVLRLNRVHVNDRCKLRLETELKCVNAGDGQSPAAVRVDLLDVPADKLLWYEIIDPIGPRDNEAFAAALAKAAAIRSVLIHGESLTSNELARQRPR